MDLYVSKGGLGVCVGVLGIQLHMYKVGVFIFCVCVRVVTCGDVRVYTCTCVLHVSIHHLSPGVF